MGGTGTNGPPWLMLEAGHLGPAPLLSSGSSESFNSLVFSGFGENCLFCCSKEACAVFLVCSELC